MSTYSPGSVREHRAHTRHRTPHKSPRRADNSRRQHASPCCRRVVLSSAGALCGPVSGRRSRGGPCDQLSSPRHMTCRKPTSPHPRRRSATVGTVGARGASAAHLCRLRRAGGARRGATHVRTVRLTSAQRPPDVPGSAPWAWRTAVTRRLLDTERRRPVRGRLQCRQTQRAPFLYVANGATSIVSCVLGTVPVNWQLACL